MNVLPLLIVILAILLSGFLLPWLGLAVTTFVVAAVGARAGPEFRLREVAAIATALAVFSVAVFIYGLGLPLPLWPRL